MFKLWLNKALNKNIFLLFFAFSFLVFLAHTTFTKTAIFADAKFYYSTTRSLVKDFDLKFTNEFENMGIKPTITHKDYVWNKYPPGASFFWMPSFILADGLSQLTNLLAQPLGATVLDTSGYGLVYQTFVASTGVFLGVLGLYFLYLVLKDYFSKKVSLLAIFTLFATTNLLFYVAVEPINSHAISFFISSLFIYCLLKRKNDKYFYLILGVLGGTAGLIRTQDLLILIIPVIKIIADRKYSQTPATNYLLLTAGALGAFAPQIIFWKLIFNTYWYSPYFEEGFDLLKPQIIHVLFNEQNGLFAITPTIAIALAGLLFLKDKHFSLKFYSFTYFFLQLFLISSWSGFFQGGSYSIRMMITTYSLLVFGLAQIIEILQRKINITKTALIIGLFSLVNSLFVIRYLLLF